MHLFSAGQGIVSINSKSLHVKIEHDAFDGQVVKAEEKESKLPNT